MQIRLAKFISYLMHPLLMPSYLLLIVFNTDSYIQLTTPPRLQLVIHCLVIITTFIMPVALSFLMLRNGVIKSIHMETKEERRLPFLVTSIFYFFTFYLLRHAQISSLIYLLFLGATLALLVAMLTNLKWKISAHMVGIGGVIGALIGISLRLFLDYRILILALLFLAGIIGSARMLLHAHSPSQIYAGFVVGLSSQLFLFLLI